MCYNLYSDVCFINLKNELGLNYDLIWSQEHLTTNYGTINFWQEYGVNYTYISPDITLNEILEIKQNTKVSQNSDYISRQEFEDFKKELMNNGKQSISRSKSNLTDKSADN